MVRPIVNGGALQIRLETFKLNLKKHHARQARNTCRQNRHVFCRFQILPREFITSLEEKKFLRETILKRNLIKIKKRLLQRAPALSNSKEQRKLLGKPQVTSSKWFP